MTTNKFTFFDFPNEGTVKIGEMPLVEGEIDLEDPLESCIK